MFDDSFARSALYFSILQLLRIFMEWIHATRHDIEEFVAGLDTRATIEFESEEEPVTSKYLSDNGEIILSHYGEVEKRLLQRINDKTEEVKSLRDGVSFR